MATNEGPFVKTVQTLVYKVPAAQPWGSTYVEIDKAYYALKQDLEKLGVIGKGENIPDSLINVLPMDDEIHVFAVIENRLRPALDADLAGLSSLE